MTTNELMFGDNLDMLRKHVRDESVDLVYLDPPFNSKADYNILFKEEDGSRSAAQVTAFVDTWEWNEESSRTYFDFVESNKTPTRARNAMVSLHDLLGGRGRSGNGMIAYLAMMAPRLLELRRVLKPTGSLYLHCDPTASHYLKVLMDAIFEDPACFRNEIVWRRTGAHNKVRRYGPVHDVLLFYTKSTAAYQWNNPKKPFMKGHIEGNFVKDDRGWRTNYYGNVLTGSGTRGGLSGKPWRGFDPTAKNRHWAIPGAVLSDILESTGENLSELNQHEKLDRLFELGFIKIVPGQAWPVYERYLREGEGQPAPDIWAFQPYTGGTVFGTDQGIDEDVRWLSPHDQKERRGYPTQKPEGLLERIVRASSDEGDLVLDPFCGCGTTVAVAQRLGRRWVGIDVTYLALAEINRRLEDEYGKGIASTYRIVGAPTSLSEADALATKVKDGRYQFQYWALDVLGARCEPKGADRGVDGLMFFHDDVKSAKSKSVVFSVKSGSVSVRDVRDLRGVVERERAAIGVLLTLREPTAPMRDEAIKAAYYSSPWGSKHPRLQILTVEELLAGKRVDMPASGDNRTHRRAPKARGKRDRPDYNLLPLRGPTELPIAEDQDDIGSQGPDPGA